MNGPQTIPLTCPECGEEQSFETWPSINVTLVPQLKGSLLNRRLLEFTCRFCNHIHTVLYPLTYHDMDRRLLVRLTVREEELPELAAEVREQLQGYRLRVVRTVSELVEKVLLAEYGLDDRAVELMKSDMMRIIRDELGNNDDPNMHFVKAFKKNDGTPMLKFEVLGMPGVPAGSVLYLDSPWRNYADAEERVTMNTNAIRARIHWERVDERYVEEMIVRA